MKCYRFFIPLLLLTFTLYSEIVSIPEKRFFERSEYGFKKELKLGQGRVGKIAGEMWDVYLPENRPSWAISYAHGYQLLRNMFKMEHFPMEAFVGIVMQESQMGCDHNAQWDSALKNPPRKLWNNQDGFYQIRSDISSGWGEMSNTVFPHRFDFNSFDSVVGTSHMETATIAAVYYIAITLYQWKYIEGYQPFELFDKCKDKEGFIKLLSSQYYMGYDDRYGVAKYFFNTKRDDAYTEPDLMTYYDAFSDPVVKMMKEHGSNVNQVVHILQDRADEIADTVDCRFGEFYDEPISWDIVDGYITKILKLYNDVDSSKFRKKIKDTFDSIKGGAALSFRYEFPPVLDEIVLQLPVDNGVNKFASYLGHNKWHDSLEYIPVFHKNETALIKSSLVNSSNTQSLVVKEQSLVFHPHDVGVFSITIYSYCGRELYRNQYDIPTKEVQVLPLDIDKLSTGCYIVKVKQKDFVHSVRFYHSGS